MHLLTLMNLFRCNADNILEHRFLLLMQNVVAFNNTLNGKKKKKKSDMACKVLTLSFQANYHSNLDFFTEFSTDQ